MTGTWSVGLKMSIFQFQVQSKLTPYTHSVILREPSFSTSVFG